MSKTPVEINATPGLFWLFASPFGRVSRKVYWLGFLLIWAIVGLAVNMWLNSVPPEEDLLGLDIASFMESNPLFPILFLVLQWLELALVIKRCQDMGMPGFAAALIFVPVVNVLAVILLGLFPSARGPNRYGPFPDSYYRGKA
ncbi:DUF805 domain-containing protein [Roseibium aestuarii]|uniref:DUF805 domain-containing protein n=1 Tax=Roseibium aestuarii TaxID=2600299 RepID=A0ABW4JW26_9HYPH|nr:DUF805 domain-containing protein [Roseibium aestuarii]